MVHENRVIGAVVKTRNCSKPIYVSIGNKISLETAVKLVKNCSPNSRIPEPILQAHKIASEKKKRLALKVNNLK
jgi:deoxyribonuclease V